MCLSSLSKIRKQFDLNKPFRAYKVFRSDVVRSGVVGMHRGFFWESDRWNWCVNVKTNFHCDCERTKYKAGFHCFLEYADAITWKRLWSVNYRKSGRNGLVIRAVWVDPRTVTAVGSQQALSVVVAQSVFLPEKGKIRIRPKLKELFSGYKVCKYVQVLKGAK